MAASDDVRWLCCAVLLALNSVTIVPGVVAGPVSINSAVSPFGRNIRPIPCVSKHGQQGTCMFAMDCTRTNGKHLGTCIDRFYFGSCCGASDDDALEGNGIHHLTDPGSTSTSKPQDTAGPVSPAGTTLFRPESTEHPDNNLSQLPSSSTTPGPVTTTTVASTVTEGTTLPSTTTTTLSSSTAGTTETAGTTSTTTTSTTQEVQEPTTPSSTVAPSSTTTQEAVQPPSTTTVAPSSTTTTTTVVPPVELPAEGPELTEPPPTEEPVTPPVQEIEHFTFEPIPGVLPPEEGSTEPEDVVRATTPEPEVHESSTPTTTTTTTTEATTTTSTTEATTTPSTTEASTTTTTAAPEVVTGTTPSTVAPTEGTTASTSAPSVTVEKVDPTSSTTESPPTTTTTAANLSSTAEPTTAVPDLSSSSSPLSNVSTSTILPDFSNETSTTVEGATVQFQDYREVCGRPKYQYPSARIVGGSTTHYGQWPWQVSLRQWRTATFLHKCGAALLNENWAITAAHCVDNVQPDDLLLRMGEYDLATDEEEYPYVERKVQIVASHPQFDSRTFEYDLALLRFYDPVRFQPNIIPICLPPVDPEVDFVGRTAYVTGWGRLYEDGPLPSKMQQVDVPVINNTECENMYRRAGYVEHIPNIFICAGYSDGKRDSCEGDSGGPLVIQLDNVWRLAGVISWGIGCAEANQPGVYTRITEFREWIDKIIVF